MTTGGLATEPVSGLLCRKPTSSRSVDMVIRFFLKKDFCEVLHSGFTLCPLILRSWVCGKSVAAEVPWHTAVN